MEKKCGHRCSSPVAAWCECTKHRPGSDAEGGRGRVITGLRVICTFFVFSAFSKSDLVR